MPPQPRIGGSFAPPLTTDKIAFYRTLTDATDTPLQVREVMSKLCDMVESFHSQSPTPLRVHRENGNGSPHPSGTGFIAPLSTETIKTLDPHVPWKEELAMYAQVFDAIDPVGYKALRDAAFHLLWFATELNLDRHPLTSDQL